MSSTTIIAIDGPAGAGKSTVAKALARRLNYSYLDTGAMYRALTVKALRSGVNLEDEDQLVQLAKATTIRLKGGGQTELAVLLDGADVSQEIRSLDVTNNTFYVARAPRIREMMVNWQREMGKRNNVVIEGRDVGTVVFPKATHKFYLDADIEERTKRRLLEMKEKDGKVDKDQLTIDLQERDKKDMTRKSGPLKKADDAIFIDSTHLVIDEVVEKILENIAQREQRKA